jgi:IS4 transposase
LWLKSDENEKIYKPQPLGCAVFDIINNENTNFIDIKLRLIKYIVNNKKYILGTTLLDTEFTIEKLAKLYHDRWKIETYFRTIKYDISFKNFHSKKENL